MTIYGEFLFAENFISGIVILMLTAKMRGITVRKWRISAGAILCGLYSFVLFLHMGWVLSLLGKLLFSVAAVITAFGRSDIRATASTVGVFYMMSFLAGGVTIALMYCFRIPGMSANGSVYIKGLTYIQIAAGLAASWFLGKWIAELLREKAARKAVMRRVEVMIDEDLWCFNALVDTGNFLRDPVSGRPAAVISRSGGMEIKKKMDESWNVRMCLIPYKSVGRSGLLEGIRPDLFIIDGTAMEGIALAIGETDFQPVNGIEKYDILLHSQHLKGEDCYG